MQRIIREETEICRWSFWELSFNHIVAYFSASRVKQENRLTRAISHDLAENDPVDQDGHVLFGREIDPLNGEETARLTCSMVDLQSYRYIGIGVLLPAKA